ncbi:VOC family protein [Lewinella sp. W8]|uniref:VOC family protein n=1 Tax=Lewinella sp. W8 TaxID=2528208 RepID=UPI00156513CC|nr:VOC family protein [Lewinella sp. W8]
MKKLMDQHGFTILFLALLVTACQEAAPEEVPEESPELTVAIEAEGEYAPIPVAIGLMVTDLDASINFYQNILGLTPTGGFDLDGDFGRRSGLTDNQPLSVKTFTFGEGPSATTLKLVTSPPTKAEEHGRYIHDGDGVQYLTVMVNSVSPILERLGAHQIPLLGETPINLGSEENERLFVLVQDPDGTLVELIETGK